MQPIAFNNTDPLSEFSSASSAQLKRTATAECRMLAWKRSHYDFSERLPSFSSWPKPKKHCFEESPQSQRRSLSCRTIRDCGEVQMCPFEGYSSRQRLSSSNGGKWSDKTRALSHLGGRLRKSYQQSRLTRLYDVAHSQWSISSSNPCKETISVNVLLRLNCLFGGKF